jgi:hypothetical protein
MLRTRAVEQNTVMFAYVIDSLQELLQFLCGFDDLICTDDSKRLPRDLTLRWVGSIASDSTVVGYKQNTASLGLSLTHKSSQYFSGTGSGSASTTEILGIYRFNTSLEQL